MFCGACVSGDKTMIVCEFMEGAAPTQSLLAPPKTLAPSISTAAQPRCGDRLCVAHTCSLRGPPLISSIAAVALLGDSRIHELGRFSW